MRKLVQTRNGQVKHCLSPSSLSGSAGAHKEFASFACTNKTNLLCQRPDSIRLLINAKGFLNLPNLVILIGSIRSSQNLVLKLFGELLERRVTIQNKNLNNQKPRIIEKGKPQYKILNFSKTLKSLTLRISFLFF